MSSAEQTLWLTLLGKKHEYSVMHNINLYTNIGIKQTQHVVFL